jgi:hypothetical protein
VSFEKGNTLKSWRGAWIVSIHGLIANLHRLFMREF